MSQTPGSRSKQLIAEMRRASASGSLFLPRYNEESVRLVLRESTELYSQIEEMAGDDRLDNLPEAVKIACMVNHASIKHNKRCSLAYIDQRATTIKKLRWELSAVLPGDILNNMSNQERALFQDYDKLITDYIQATDVDLTADLTPPKDLLIQVRVLKDCGEIMTEGGAVTLDKGTTHSLRRRDIEHLVRQGYLEEHNQHESC